MLALINTPFVLAVTTFAESNLILKYKYRDIFFILYNKYKDFYNILQNCILFLQSFDIQGPNSGFVYVATLSTTTQQGNFANVVGQCMIGKYILTLFHAGDLIIIVSTTIL